MRIQPEEKRQFLLRHLGPVRLKRLEDCQDDAACSADLARKEREFQDVVTGVKAKADPVAGYIADLAKLGPRPLGKKEQTDIQEFVAAVEGADPWAGPYLADLARRGPVRG